MITEQANGSANGWIFQVSAGIVLTLRNIKDFDKIKLEGKTEDIELVFTNGKGLYAQAKSVLDINDAFKINESFFELAKMKMNQSVVYTAEDAKRDGVFIKAYQVVVPKRLTKEVRIMRYDSNVLSRLVTMIDNIK
ncbi:MAG: hypothetical protein PHW40_01300 [Candidatus Izemoplasmatales bacterium]|nr:hypothetical protein [Candidatus Izemoplasmatales bacterium]